MLTHVAWPGNMSVVSDTVPPEPSLAECTWLEQKKQKELEQLWYILGTPLDNHGWYHGWSALRPI